MKFFLYVQHISCLTEYTESNAFDKLLPARKVCQVTNIKKSHNKMQSNTRGHVLTYINPPESIFTLESVSI